MEILNKAVQLIQQRGFANLSLGNIADAIGIKREGLYYYYKSRFDILLAIVKPTAEDLVKGLKTILAEDIPADQKLQRAVENHLMQFERAHAQTRIALRDTYFQENEAILKTMRPIWETYGNLWIKLIEEGQKTLLFRADIDARVAAFGLLGMCNWISRWYTPKKPISVKQLIDAYSSISLCGILLDGNTRSASDFGSPAAERIQSVFATEVGSRHESHRRTSIRPHRRPAD